MYGKHVNLVLQREDGAAGYILGATILSIAMGGIDLSQGEWGVRQRFWTETQKNKT